MNRTRTDSPTAVCYGIAVAGVAVAVLARTALDAYLQDRLPYAVFFVAVTATAWLCSPGPALLSATLGFLSAHWFFISPRHRAAPIDTADVIAAVLYFVVTLVLILSAHIFQKARDRAISRNDELAKEIAERKRAEEEIRMHAEELSFISATAAQMFVPSTRSELVELTAERIYSVAGGAIVLFNQYDFQNGRIVVKKCRCTPEEREIITKILGRDPEGMAFSFPEDLRARVLPAELDLLEGGIYELAFGQLPPRFCRLIENKLNLGDIYALTRSFGEDILGTVALLTHERETFQNKIFVETVVSQAALVLRSLGAEEMLHQRTLELQQVTEDLETRIQERTAQLARANKILGESETRLRSLSTQIIAAQENERKAVAHELHDTIGANLAAVQHSLETKLQQLEKGANSKEVALEEVLSLLRNTMEENRKIQLNLRPSILDDEGFIPAISWYSRETRKAYPAVHIEAAIAIAEREIPEDLKLVLFRIVQESVNNAITHGESSRIRIGVDRAGVWLRLMIEDNGRGFESPLDNTGRQVSGKGLGIMQQRAEASGGIFSITSKPGEGTMVKAEWKIGGNKISPQRGSVQERERFGTAPAA